MNTTTQHNNSSTTSQHTTPVGGHIYTDGSRGVDIAERVRNHVTIEGVYGGFFTLEASEDGFQNLTREQIEWVCNFDNGDWEIETEAEKQELINETIDGLQKDFEKAVFNYWN